ncbi:hypothetical protein GALL_517870 [mine drainage metagenome]|uniref:Uncharacterized protein n=1 Tax=mine drainage metagenome TaxID=410659 RepID=A0A1J5P616_9ZZZZ
MARMMLAPAASPVMAETIAAPIRIKDKGSSRRRRMAFSSPNRAGGASRLGPTWARIRAASAELSPSGRAPRRA